MKDLKWFSLLLLVGVLVALLANAIEDESAIRQLEEKVENLQPVYGGSTHVTEYAP